jgi:hypothetical protein
MKKNLTLLLLVFTFIVPVFSQTYTTVDLTNDVYSLLSMCEEKNYCERLSSVKPYTESYILKILNQSKDSILEKMQNDNSYIYKTELESIEYYISTFEPKNGLNFSTLSYRYAPEDSQNSFEFSNRDELFVSSGFYDDSELNSTGYEIFHNFDFVGDFTKYLSYRITGFIGATRMPLQQVGDDYLIGYWWYDDWDYTTNGENNQKRTINTYRNNSVLPYSYKKKWDGSIYYLTNVSYSGLKGWAFEHSLGFGMYAELRTSLLNDKLNIGIGRINRDWASMDLNSSLVLNSNAAPFLGIDANVDLFDWISFSTLTGVMEFPNAKHINANAWFYRDFDSTYVDEETGEIKYKNHFSTVDSYFFQNLYSVGMLDLNFKYLQANFGSAVIWPKRFELGYMFPLVNHVVYQNSVGDFDNLALFGSIKGILPGIGNAWLSIYLDELSSFKSLLKFDVFKKTRDMFAYQAGTRINVPFLPFTSVSFRYTKIEPYCYTHQSTPRQPWYDYYISESYTNNGKSLGYYLEPNSDEIFVRVESKPLPTATFGLQYQLIRHGADYGSGAVPGSSIWSELPVPSELRNSFYKYFLHDGTYEWTHTIALDASYIIKQSKIPLQIYGGIGYVYDFFTQSEKGANQKSPYHKINTVEYPTKKGCVMYFGLKLFAF